MNVNRGCRENIAAEGEPAKSCGEPFRVTETRVLEPVVYDILNDTFRPDTAMEYATTIRGTLHAVCLAGHEFKSDQ